MDAGSSEQVTRNGVDNLRYQLDHHLRSVDLASGDEPRIEAALQWLLATRSGRGYWGYQSPAVTATNCLAIAAWKPAEATSLIGPSIAWLLEQSDETGWETLWDTAVSLAAITSASQSRSSGVQELVNRLVDNGPENAKPHHAAQVLLLGVENRWDLTVQRQWADRVRDTLNQRDGSYVLGQAVHALIASGDSPSELDTELGWLSDYLIDTPLSTSAFLDHASALRALAISGAYSDTVDHTVDEFFGDAHRRDGSWYHEPWYTAWALLALHEVRSVRRYVVEQPAMNRYFNDVEHLVVSVRDVEQRRDEDQRKVRWLVVRRQIA